MDVRNTARSISYDNPVSALFLGRTEFPVLVSGGQNQGAVLRNCDGVLKMSAVTSVDRNCRPTVRKDLNFRLTSVNHGLNGQNHPRLQARPLAPASKVRDLGV